MLVMMKQFSHLLIITTIMALIDKTISNTNNGGCSKNLKFSNPMLENFSSEVVAFSMHNRCMLYPRCLLFNCCNSTLLEAVDKYLSGTASSCTRGKFSNSNCDNCGIDSPISHRLKSLSISNITITHKMVSDGIANFPPTSAEEFKRLRRRSKQQQSSEFKVLYLIQGPAKSKLEMCASQMKDMIFLNYLTPTDGDLYFPASNFSYGRMALYWAARSLEVHQGWLYNYLAFLDDDVDFGNGNLTHFEEFLRTWQPAVGLPGYIPGKYPRQEVQTIGFHDFIFVGYHREAVETVLPFAMHHEYMNCTWASQYMNNLETNSIYRNHILAFKQLQVWNGQHRKYSSFNCSAVFPVVLLDHIQTLPPPLRHCAYSKERVHPRNFHPDFGFAVGEKRHKMLPYDLPSLLLYHAGSSGNNTVSSSTSNSSSKMEIMRASSYALTSQVGCGQTPEDWNPSKVDCCSVDIQQQSIA